MQEPVFKLREYFRKAGVHKNPDYKDLEEHIAVQMEFLRYLLENGNEDLYRDFFKNQVYEVGVFLLRSACRIYKDRFLSGSGPFYPGSHDV